MASAGYDYNMGYPTAGDRDWGNTSMVTAGFSVAPMTADQNGYMKPSLSPLPEQGGPTSPPPTDYYHYNIQNTDHGKFTFHSDVSYSESDIIIRM